MSNEATAAIIRAVMRLARGLALASVALTLWLSGCSVTQPSLVDNRPSVRFPTKPPPVLASFPHPAPTPAQERPARLPQTPTVSQTGIASWYGPRFHGKRTANGEVYNQYALTAAHETLPFGSRAIVTNLNTGQSIEVRINDRGPLSRGRVIDLSQAAARLVGVVGPGVAPVKIEVMSPKNLPIAEEKVLPVAHAVLLASSTDEAEATAVMNEVSQRYEDVYLSPLSSGALRYYQVRLGLFHSRDEALQRAREVARTGMQALVVGEASRRAER